MRFIVTLIPGNTSPVIYFHFFFTYSRLYSFLDMQTHILESGDSAKNYNIYFVLFTTYQHKFGARGSVVG
jgi:hypothetical protein